MGVAGLWELLRPAAKTHSLTELAIKEGFEANPDGKRGFRLGIDASIWFFHAEYGKEGENPVLRTLFFRCATLMHTTFLPIFVFDGPKRPDVKRGKKINKTGHKLIPGMKQIVEAFGFEWRMAPGEAEAELAYLNRIGVIDGVLSDDVDNFLFGATTVVRNSSATLSGNRSNPAVNSAGKEDKNHTHVFRLQDIKDHPDVRLTRGGMILIGLMSGGDYHTAGVPRCGKVTAHGLAKCGFGDSLYDAAVNLDRQDLAEFIVHWREQLRQELRTNSKGEIGRKQVALANSFPRDFPDIDILISYVRPITSESMGRESNNTKLTWSKEPDLGKLAATCEFYFEWGYKEAIIKRFRTVMWHSIILRILRRAVLDLDGKRPAQRGIPSTPRKSKAGEPCGTPSKMIAQHFSSLGLTTPTRTYLSGSESEDEDEDRLLVKVHTSRTHPSTNGLLEYRLEIAPKQLVRLAEAGIKGTRIAEGPDEWASGNEDEDGGGTKKRGKSQPIDPETHLRLWMPACMVKIVEPRLVQEFEDIQEQKLQKKLKKGTKTSSTSYKAPKKTKKSAQKPTAAPSDDFDVFSSPIPDKPKEKAQTVTMHRVEVQSEASTDEEVSSDPDLPATLFNSVKAPKPGEVPVLSSDKELSVVQPVATSRTGIKDLTRRKPSSITATSTSGLKTFFPVTKSSNKIFAKSQSTSTRSSPHIDLFATYSLGDAPETSNRNGPSTCKTTKTIKDHVPHVTTGKAKDRLAANAASSSAHGQSAKSKSNSAFYDSDDSSCGEYDPRIWAKHIVAPGFSISSPSKRKTHAKGSSAPSDSESSHRLKKSPRKKLTQTSPQFVHRPVSPSPGRLRSPVLWKICNEVIEVSTDAESDDDLPRGLQPLSQSKKDLPPLLRARAKVGPKSLSNTIASSNRPAPKKPHTIISDVIDLT